MSITSYNREDYGKSSGELTAFTGWEPVHGVQNSANGVFPLTEDTRECRVTVCLRDSGDEKSCTSFRKCEWYNLLIENVRTIVYRSLVHPSDQLLAENMIPPAIQPGMLAGAHKTDKSWNPSTDEPIKPEARNQGALQVHNTALYNRHCEKLRRIAVLLNTEERIQKEKTWEKGFKIILNCIDMLGFNRYGIVLVNPVRKKLELFSGRGITFSEDLPKLKNPECSIVKCIQEKKVVHIKENSGGECESDSRVWVPILVQGEVFAVVTAYTKKESSIEEDIEDLKIIAGLCQAFIDRTRIKIEPRAKEIIQETPKYQLDPSEAYIVLEKRCEKSLEIFCDLLTHGIPGIAISRIYPERLKKGTLIQIPVVWLSQYGGENTVTPDDLYKLTYTIGEFTRQNPESVILLEGLEYLTAQTSFETVLRYVHDLKDTAFINNSRLILSLHKGAFSPREYNMLKREFVVMNPGDTFRFLTKGWNRITSNPLFQQFLSQRR